MSTIFVVHKKLNMSLYFSNYQDEIINTIILLIILFIIRSIIVITVKKIGKKSGTTEARAGLIGRYATVTLVLIAILIEAFILGAKTTDITLVFSSVFAVIGVALFAIWSILSWEETTTSGYGDSKKTLTTKATKLESIKSDYWNKKSIADESLRETLKLQ